MTSPQDPWQQGGSPQQPPGGNPQHPGNQPPQHPGGPPSGGFPQYPGGPPSGGFPQHPGAPQGMPDPYAAPPPPGQQGGAPRPSTVETAFWIAVVVPILATVLTVLGFVLGQPFAEEVMARQIGDTTPEALEFGRAVMIVTFGLQTFFYLVLTGLWILFGFKMRGGRNWARVTLTVFAALWVVQSLIGLLTGGTGMNPQAAGLPAGVEVPTSMLVLSYVTNGVGLAGMGAFLVLVYLKRSNWYFQAARFRG
ncbi:DUF485 domain-containing protein [Salinifilum ghardaiensis]